MAPSVNARLDGVPLKNLKASVRTTEPDLKRVKGAGALVKLALVRAGISQKQAALDMGLSDAQLSAQLADKEGEHLSWQRLQALPDAFFLELLILLAEHRGIARVRMTMDLERKVSA